MNDYKLGKLMNEKLLAELCKKFAFLDHDPDYGERLFFDNSGGSLKLKEAIKMKESIDLLPDCPERYHQRAIDFNSIMDRCTEDVLNVIFGSNSGSLITDLSASQSMFKMVSTIIETVEGTNAVTTNIEHPSAYDAVKFYCKKNNKEFRVAEANVHTGFVDPESITEKIDKDTILLSVIASSNISGNIMDLEKIIKTARAKKPDLYIIVDAVQHMPHGTLNVEQLGIDGVNFAPYKFMASRGIGFAYVSDRLSKLPHQKLYAKDDSVWELGSPTPALFASMSAVIDYVCWLGSYDSIGDMSRRDLYLKGMEKIVLHERALLHRLLEGSDKIEGLRHMDKVKVFADYPDLTKRDLIVAIGIEGRDYEQLRKDYQDRGVTVYERVNTSVYSKRILEAIGLTGAIRVSPFHCHTVDDIDKFLSVTKELSVTRELANS
ncbi:aminotransferase class V-fold PLP-dependent enzyme [Bacillus sp. ISL-4]|uniref:aminotransferase class V-fold PLP-dependent enzyme n=1 Tax=Bacillus sp. ISL-4 TaxID=2819125 RepID=UPI001BEAA096|nr:aminotransferase class V-fold PLP-dependent enzyme [Bacillus sp. ISL-4]MBT2667249.1 aminotransferase class V-fold PLP-dependent enzyme [Bacillus sp. ISL-4]MBT2673933.1 aminotransferase class V-fold PLP-dependent enzyme [Streptomyces sp. ISL-14]